MQVNPLVADLEHVLVHTEQLWEPLRGQRIFITGGTGFFGCWLLESFSFANETLGLKARAVVLTRSAKAFHEKAPRLAAKAGLELLEGDLRTCVLPTGEFSHLIHAATETNANATPLDPLTHFEANTQGTRRVANFAADAGTRKLLFTSSGAVYGPQPSDLTHVPETYAGAPSPLDTNTAYGQSKRASEFICAAKAKESGFDAMIARCFAFVGPHLSLDANFAIGNFTRDALAGGPIRVGGDGTPFRSYLYAADLMIWLWTILFRGESSTAYNVGSDVDLTIADLARTMAEVVNPRVKVVIEGVPDPKHKPQRYVPCIQKARRDLGLRPLIELREGIRRMADWNCQILS